MQEITHIKHNEIGDDRPIWKGSKGYTVKSTYDVKQGIRRRDSRRVTSKDT